MSSPDAITEVRPEGVDDRRRHGARRRHPDPRHRLRDHARGRPAARPRRRLPRRRWAEHREAYRGTTVAGYPNYFMLVGPNTATGHTLGPALRGGADRVRAERRTIDFAGASLSLRQRPNGASRTRTDDLLGAIQALFQLSYSPALRRLAPARRRIAAAWGRASTTCLGRLRRDGHSRRCHPRAPGAEARARCLGGGASPAGGGGSRRPCATPDPRTLEDLADGRTGGRAELAERQSAARRRPRRKTSSRSSSPSRTRARSRSREPEPEPRAGARGARARRARGHLPEPEAEPPARRRHARPRLRGRGRARTRGRGRSPDDGDVLEDTPDFLQETPEHDRLWFEQKPPRDFDFD